MVQKQSKSAKSGKGGRRSTASGTSGKVKSPKAVTGERDMRAQSAAFGAKVKSLLGG